VLANILFDGLDKHMTAEQVYETARKGRGHVSLATVYNTLHQFTGACLLRQVVVGSAQVYFDTNVTPHYHVYDAAAGALFDINAAEIQISGLPKPPRGRKVERVDVVVGLASD